MIPWDAAIVNTDRALYNQRGKWVGVRFAPLDEPCELMFQEFQLAYTLLLIGIALHPLSCCWMCAILGLFGRWTPECCDENVEERREKRKLKKKEKTSMGSTSKSFVKNMKKAQAAREREERRRSGGGGGGCSGCSGCSSEGLGKKFKARPVWMIKKEKANEKVNSVRTSKKSSLYDLSVEDGRRYLKRGGVVAWAVAEYEEVEVVEVEEEGERSEWESSSSGGDGGSSSSGGEGGRSERESSSSGGEGGRSESEGERRRSDEDDDDPVRKEERKKKRKKRKRKRKRKRKGKKKKAEHIEQCSSRYHREMQ